MEIIISARGGKSSFGWLHLYAGGNKSQRCPMNPRNEGAKMQYIRANARTGQCPFDIVSKRLCVASGTACQNIRTSCNNAVNGQRVDSKRLRHWTGRRYHRHHQHHHHLGIFLRYKYKY